MSDLEARIAEVLKAHSYKVDTLCVCGYDYDSEGGPWEGFDLEVAKHQTVMLAPLIAEHAKEERADELLKAAGDVFDTAIPAAIARWLEARAGKLIGQITGPDCQANKHKACDGRALHEASDSIVACQCACHP